MKDDYTLLMRYDHLTRYTDAEFKRLVGVTRKLFDLMIEILTQAEQQKKKSGRPHSLSLADQLLLTLNYLRCYKTQIQLSADFNLSESNVNRTIRKVENALIQSGQFSLPKRTHRGVNPDEDVVAIDVTECLIELPKKSSQNTTVVRRSGTA